QLGGLAERIAGLEHADVRLEHLAAEARLEPAQRRLDRPVVEPVPEGEREEVLRAGALAATGGLESEYVRRSAKSFFERSPPREPIERSLTASRFSEVIGISTTW